MANLNTPHEHITDPSHEEVENLLREYAQKNPLDKFCIYVEDGVLHPEKVTESGLDGLVSGKAASNLKLKSDTERLNAVYVTGKGSNYEIDGVDFQLKGNGCNDFSGVGSGICVDNGAKLTLRNAKIVTQGAVRPAMRTTGGAELHAYDCEFRSLGGGLSPETFTPPEDTGMWFPPAPLKLDGDCRTTLTMNGGKSYYNRCTVVCDKWGALATDCALGYVYLEANDCKVVSEGNGYVTYSDDDTHVVINNSELKSATVCGIQAGESDLSFHGCTVDCGTHFVMIHEVLNDYQTIGLSRITDCKIRCGGPVVYIREASCDCYVARCELHPANGELVHMVVSDDPNLTKLRPGEVSFGAQITFDEMTLEGDVLNDVSDRDIVLKLTKTELRGRMDNVNLQLFDSSCWMATADSSVTLTGPVAAGAIDAPAGVVITAKKGEGCALSGETKLASGGLLRVQ